MIDGVWWDTSSVSGVKVRCDPPLNLDLHSSRHFLASESILQLIVCSSHRKERRWLRAAGTSLPSPKGRTSCLWMGIHGRRMWEQLWREEGGCYCFSSDATRRPAQKWGVSFWPGERPETGFSAWKTRETEPGLPPLLSPKRCEAAGHSRGTTGTCVCAHRSCTVRGGGNQ